MGRLAIVAAGVLAGFVIACAAGTFGCEDDAQCDSEGIAGVCEASGFCSFPDDTCTTGHRYGAFAPGELASACVPAPGDASGSTSNATTTPTPTPPQGSESSTTLTSSGTSGPTSTTTTGPVDDPTSTGTPETSSTSRGTDSGTTVPMLDFVDAFDRLDDLDIGNDWIEKTPTAFQLVDEEVVFESTAGGYSGNVVYRPFSDSLADVEVIMELRFDEVGPPGHPQVHARLQSDDIDSGVTCYILFIESAALLEITRQEGSVFAGRWGTPISRPLDTSSLFRLRLRVQGASPVDLDGYLERWDGDGWVEHAHLDHQDTDPTQLTDPGTVGFSGHDQLDHYRYDRFTVQAL